MGPSSDRPSLFRLLRALDALPTPRVPNPWRPEAADAVLAETAIDTGPTVVRWDGASVVEITATTRGRRAGELRMATYPADALAHRGGLVGCWQGLETIQRQVPRAGDEVAVGLCAVEHSQVDAFARGAGVGLALYLTAAREARLRFHAAITSHRCVGGSTSVEANRVWNSERFRREVRVAGKVGWWVGPHATPRV